MYRSFRTGLLALALVAAPLVLAAQQSPATRQPTPQQQQQLQAWATELQQIGERVMNVQMRVLQDPAISTRHQALGAEIEAAVVKHDASLASLPERVQQLEAQMRDAYEKRDEARFQQLQQQGQQLEARFIRARAAALAEPGLAGRMQAFQTELERRMLQIEPELPKLMERGRELQTRLQAAMGGQPGS
jgi:chromosome segregation ATPase